MDVNHAEDVFAERSQEKTDHGGGVVPCFTVGHGLILSRVPYKPYALAMLIAFSDRCELEWSRELVVHPHDYDNG